MNEKQQLLSRLPSVDEILKSTQGIELLHKYPRRFVLQGVRQGIDHKRTEILAGRSTDLSEEVLVADIDDELGLDSRQEK